MAGRLRYAQVDINLLGDPKVRRLFRALDERDAYAALGIWLDVLLSSWDAEGPTVSASDVLGENAYDDLRRGLTDVGLLDPQGRIPKPTWDKWWATVESDRERWRASKRKTRMSTDVHVDTRGQPRTDVDTRGPSYSPSHSPSPSLPGEGLGVGDRTPGLDLTWNALTGGRVPSDRQLTWLRSMEKEHGTEWSIRVMEEVYAQTRNPDTLLRDTQDALQARRNEATKREEDDREERQRQARDDRSRRQLRELREQEARASADPRPLADIMPDIAERFGKEGRNDDVA